MGFGSSLDRGSTTKANEVQDPVYLKLADERVIRILDHEEFSYWRYFMNVTVNGRTEGRPVVVGDNQGPVAKFMASIGEADPRFRKVQKRMMLNVLDRTPVKKTSTGVAVYAGKNGAFPTTDPATGENLASAPVVPNNKVLVIDFGSALMKQLTVFHNRMRRNKGPFEPLPIWALDLRIVTTLKNPTDPKSADRAVVPEADQEPLPEELASLPRYDLAQLVRPMPHEMQQRLLDGEDYVTILKELGWERPVPTVK